MVIPVAWKNVFIVCWATGSKLETSVENRESQVIAIRVDKNFESLHNEPAFQGLIAKVGPPPLG